MTAEQIKALFIGMLAVSFASFAFLAVVAWRQGPRTPYLRRWVLFCALAAGFSLDSILVGYGPTRAVSEVATRVGFCLAGVAVWVFLHFALAFVGRVRYQRAVSTVGAVWLALLLPLFLGTDVIISGVTAQSGFSQFAPQAGPAIPFYTLYLAYCWALALGLFVRTYRRSTGLRRTQLAYMLVAFVFGAVGSTSTLLPSLLGKQTLIAFLPAFLFPLFPITITYAIVRHRLWDVRTIVHKTTAWVVLSVLLMVPMYLVLWAAQVALPNLSDVDRTALLTLFFLLGYRYVRAVQPRLDHLFQRRAYDWRRALDQFSRDMAQVGRPEAVARRLCVLVEENLYPERVAVFFRRELGPIWERAVRPEEASPPATPPLYPDHPVIEVLTRHGAAVELGQIEVDPALAPIRDQARAFFGLTSAQVVVPLVQGDSLLGLVILDRKRSLKPYARPDLEFLEQIAASAVVGLANGLLFEEVVRQRSDLQELTGSLEQRVQERTRELEQVNLKLARANDDLKEMDQLKTRFFANVSHELRTPLTLILAPLDAMLAGELGAVAEQLGEQLRVMRRNGLSLLKLINNLLDLNRIEEERMKLYTRHIDLAAFVQERVELTRPLARQERIELHFEAVASPLVDADEEKLERVVINLLSNALKFTDPGGRVLVLVGERDDNAFFAVQDTGIGIPDHEIPYVFDRFRQVDASSTRAHGGAGIGLALVQELVTLHGGEVRVGSECGVGSTFTVNLPRLKGAQAAQARPRVDTAERERVRRRWESDSSPGWWSNKLLSTHDYRFMEVVATTDVALAGGVAPEARGAETRDADRDPGALQRVPTEEMPEVLDAIQELIPVEHPDWAGDEAGDGAASGAPGGAGLAARETVLLVEDNQDLVTTITPILSRRYEVITAENGAVGLRMARRKLPSLVLCDMMMPVMDGLTLCRKLKGDLRTAAIPVIMITARTGIEDSVAALDAGADDYVPKPFSVRELISRIGAQIRTRQLDQAISRSERMAALGSTAGGMAHEILNPLNAIINGLEALSFTDGEGQEDLMRVIRSSAHRILETVEALKSFVRQGEGEWDAVDLNDGVRDTLKILSHRMRGIAVHTDLRLDQAVVCYGAQINQVVMNLLCNAADAVEPGKGEVWVRTEAAGGMARIVVRDNGPGIGGQDRTRIFYPYFTTKPVGKGTGMGLPMSRQIVEQHGGTLAVTSAPDEGAELTVSLPLQPAMTESGPLPRIGTGELGAEALSQ